MNERYCKQHVKLHQWKPLQSKEQRKRENKHYNLYQRDEEANIFYHSSQWQKIRDYVYARDMATDQVTGNSTKNTLIVDHVIPLKYCTKEQRLDPDNLWCLTRETHNVKTKLEQQIASKPNGINILKHANKDWWTKVLKERIK
ncbi:HNH endonuclease signature motif containing protein [Liquorilactobacillus uvarum]|uniref:HNH endonuclease signature motif containing protein n=1 Tax=Liquorilactobacillus uvarum TaxID=303240 RepID=UPI002888FF30|nr:HNH endonuclease signature motif containing protein [Liquorilactobacillus uvarum]